MRKNWREYGVRELRWRVRYGSSGVILGLTLPAPLVRDFGFRAGVALQVEGCPEAGEIRLRVMERLAQPEEVLELVPEDSGQERELEELIEEVMG